MPWTKCIRSEKVRPVLGEGISIRPSDSSEHTRLRTSLPNLDMIKPMMTTFV